MSHIGLIRIGPWAIFPQYVDGALQQLIGQCLPRCRLGPLILTVWVQVGSLRQCRLGPDRIFDETTFFCSFNLMYAFLETDIGTPLVALKCAK